MTLPDLGDGALHAEQRCVAEGVCRVPQQIAAGGQQDLCSGAEGAGNGEQRHGAQGHQQHGQPQPAQHPGLLPEPGEPGADDGAGAGVKQPHHQRDGSHSQHGNTDVGKIGVHVHVDQKIEKILTGEVQSAAKRIQMGSCGGDVQFHVEILP